jgi:hypothetical protein
MRILVNDVWKAGTITASTEAAGYPAANSQHVHLSRKWRSTALTSQWVKVDLGAAVAADCIAIAGHNLTAAAVVKVQASDTDAWGSPVIDKAGDPLDSVILIPFSLDSRRWWRITVDDSTNPDGYVQLGRIFLCQRYESVEPIAGGFIGSVEDSTVTKDSITGQRFADVGVVRKTYRVTMGTMKNETKEAIDACYAAAGVHQPVIVEPADGIARMYATFDGKPQFTAVGAWGWTDGGIEFKEAM